MSLGCAGELGLQMTTDEASDVDRYDYAKMCGMCCTLLLQLLLLLLLPF